MPDIERRFFKCELRADAEEGEPIRIVGYAAIFNTVSEEIYGFREMIMPGAFRKVLNDDVRGLINHDPNLVLGRTASGTLRLVEDERGLRYEIDPPDTQYARDLIVSLRRGDVDQSSFAFCVDTEDEEWRAPTEADPLPLRIIHSFSRLYDVSPVTYPAYQSTSVAVRALDKAKQLAIPTGGATGDEANVIAVGRRDLLRRKIQLLKLRGYRND